MCHAKYALCNIGIRESWVPHGWLPCHQWIVISVRQYLSFLVQTNEFIISELILFRALRVTQRLDHGFRVLAPPSPPLTHYGIHSSRYFPHNWNQNMSQEKSKSELTESDIPVNARATTIIAQTTVSPSNTTQNGGWKPIPIISRWIFIS